MYAELASYAYPKRKAVELRDGGPTITFRLHRDLPKDTQTSVAGRSVEGAVAAPSHAG
jgi:hypothetical protein